MKRAAIVLAALVMAACGAHEPPTVNVIKVLEAPNSTTWRVQRGYYVERIGPDEFGVACYTSGTSSLSCVKVQ